MYAATVAEVEEMTNKQHYDQMIAIGASFAISPEYGETVLMKLLPEEEREAYQDILKQAKETRAKIRRSEEEN
ncbi:MAG: hypothetical protein LBN43_00175 [Oscillospiraceae bacterium]|jgi:hypothetical protein|nr:hypothetical protein [Oscillospiraceae bacterium]